MVQGYKAQGSGRVKVSGRSSPQETEKTNEAVP